MHDSSPNQADAGAQPALRFAKFYLLALGIVSVVVAIRQSVGAAELLPALWSFLEERGMYANSASIALFSLQDWRALLIFVFASAPTTAALAMCWFWAGSGGVRSLLRRLLPWSNVPAQQGLRVYLVLAAIYGAGCLGYLGWTAAYAPAGTIQQTLLPSLGGSSLTALLWLLVGPFLDEGGLWEELGWHGLAFPLLLRWTKSPLGASVLLGVLWWLWHFPRELITLSTGPDLGQWAQGQAIFVLLCVALSIVMAPAWFRTGGSALPALLIHGFTNVWSKALSGPLWQGLGVDVRTWVVVAAAIVVMVVTRGRLGAPASSPELDAMTAVP